MQTSLGTSQQASKDSTLEYRKASTSRSYEVQFVRGHPQVIQDCILMVQYCSEQVSL